MKQHFEFSKDKKVTNVKKKQRIQSTMRTGTEFGIHDRNRTSLIIRKKYGTALGIDDTNGSEKIGRKKTCEKKRQEND